MRRRGRRRRERKRNRQARRRSPTGGRAALERRRALAIDADRVDQHFGLAHDLLTSATPTRLLVSLPSEMMTIAFLRFCPLCAIGTASATASYIAVPPFGWTRLITRRCVAIGRPVRDQVGAAAEAIQEELVQLVVQLGRNRSIASRAACHFSPCMLPLVSTTMPRLTGVRSALKCVTSTGLLSS